jgi:hypothetical protein
MIKRREPMKGTCHEFRTVMLLLLMAASTMAHAATIQAQTANWYEWSASSAPPSREDMAMAYDQERRSTLLFGGCCNPSETWGDTWIFDGGWRQVFPSSSPSPRMGAAMTFDGTAGNIVLFGGCSGAVNVCTFLNDTWTWNGTTWTEQFPPVNPSPRVTSIAYDGATKTSVLFGGTGSAGSLADTWTWDGVAKTWTEQTPATSPSARQAPLAYDRATQTVVMFGGGNWQVEVPESGGTAFGDTWIWNGATWTQQFPSSAPSARSYFSMAYDARLGLVVLFGGAVGGDWPNSTNDTWAWNGSKWGQIHPATVPPNRYNSGMGFDSHSDVIVMFGGDSTGPSRNDTWRLAVVP